MEKEEKELTKKGININNTIITDPLDTFNKLLKIGIKKGMSIASISVKTGINRQSLYRYSSHYDSQKKTLPTLKTILKLCEVVGYEIRIFEIETERKDVIVDK